jgi:hypothetical protein
MIMIRVATVAWLLVGSAAAFWPPWFHHWPTATVKITSTGQRQVALLRRHLVLIVCSDQTFSTPLEDFQLHGHDLKHSTVQLSAGNRFDSHRHQERLLQHLDPRPIDSQREWDSTHQCNMQRSRDGDRHQLDIIHYTIPDLHRPCRYSQILPHQAKRLDPIPRGPFQPKQRIHQHRDDLGL